MNYRSFKNHIINMNRGETISINALNLSLKSIDVLRFYIKNNVLIPLQYRDCKEVKSGTVIAINNKYKKVNYLFKEN